MGQNTILTEIQKIILDEVTKNKDLSKKFYFSGGTALSEVYLKHRYSDDLDFFSREKFGTQEILTFLNLLSKKHHFSLQTQFVDPVYICNLVFDSQEDLKLDFGFYPFKQLKDPIDYLGIKVDSLFDLAVNKALSITQRTEVKDFVDLYFLLEKFSALEIIEGVKVKFNSEVEPLIFASHLMLVEDFEFMPRMIKPLELKTLKAFFLNQAKKIGMDTIEA